MKPPNLCTSSSRGPVRGRGNLGDERFGVGRLAQARTPFVHETALLNSITRLSRDAAFDQALAENVHQEGDRHGDDRHRHHRAEQPVPDPVNGDPQRASKAQSRLIGDLDGLVHWEVSSAIS